MYKHFLSAVLKEMGWGHVTKIVEHIDDLSLEEEAVLFKWRSTPFRLNNLIEHMYGSSKATDRVRKLLFGAGLRAGKLSLSLDPTDYGALECNFHVDPLSGEDDISEEADDVVRGLAWEIYKYSKTSCSELLRVRKYLVRNNTDVDDKVIWDFQTKKYRVQLRSVVDQNPELDFTHPSDWADVKKLIAPDSTYQYLGLICTISYLPAGEVLPLVVTTAKVWDVICLKSDKTYRGHRKTVIKQALCDARAIIKNQGL